MDKENLIFNFEIKTLDDVRKIKDFEARTNLKINKSKVARDLGVSRKTINNYYNGFVPSKSRVKKSQFDIYEKEIRKLLNTNNHNYMKTIYDYLVTNFGVNRTYSAFRKYIINHVEFRDYFKK